MFVGQLIFMSTLYIFVGAVLVLACIFDVRTRRIPNALTFSAIASALLFHALNGGLSAAGWSLAGCFLGLALFFPMFALRGMGAGDVKLLAAVGAWLGPSEVAMVALAASLAGGVLAIGVALAHGYLKTAVKNLWMLLMYWRVMGVRPLQQVSLEGTQGPRLAYAIPISIGTLVTLWIK